MKTFAMIKPCAIASGKDLSILADIKDAGFEIERSAELTLSQEDAEWLYREHTEKAHFNDLVAFTISGPVVIMELSSNSDNTALDFRQLMGPTDISKAEPNTLRARYAEDFRRNAIHGSDGNDSAAEELEHFDALLSSS